jgi:hypothetical protein
MLLISVISLNRLPYRFMFCIPSRVVRLLYQTLCGDVFEQGPRNQHLYNERGIDVSAVIPIPKGRESSHIPAEHTGKHYTV